jgi:hypothetical protein
MLVSANKSISLYISKNLIINKLLDKPLGIDDENLLPCGYEWKLVAIELLVKHCVNALLIYDQNG